MEGGYELVFEGREFCRKGGGMGWGVWVRGEGNEVGRKRCNWKGVIWRRGVLVEEVLRFEEWLNGECDRGIK